MSVGVLGAGRWDRPPDCSNFPHGFLGSPVASPGGRRHLRDEERKGRYQVFKAAVIFEPTTFQFSWGDIWTAQHLGWKHAVYFPGIWRWYQCLGCSGNLLLLPSLPGFCSEQLRPRTGFHHCTHTHTRSRHVCTICHAHPIQSANSSVLGTVALNRIMFTWSGSMISTSSQTTPRCKKRKERPQRWRTEGRNSCVHDTAKRYF